MEIGNEATRFLLVRYVYHCVSFLYFAAQDILTTFFLAACYFAGAVIAAVFANDLNDFVDPGLPLAILFPGQSDPFRVSKIRNALAAAAVSSRSVMVTFHRVREFFVR